LECDNDRCGFGAENTGFRPTHVWSYSSKAKELDTAESYEHRLQGFTQRVYRCRAFSRVFEAFRRTNEYQAAICCCCSFSNAPFRIPRALLMCSEFRRECVAVFPKLSLGKHTVRSLDALCGVG